jgi:cytochrome P450
VAEVAGVAKPPGTAQPEVQLRSGLPPGPRAPALLQGLAYLLAGNVFIDRCIRRYGDTFTLRITGLGTIVALRRAADIKTIFTAAPDMLDAGSGNRPIEILLGSRSLLVLDGAEHMRMRKLLLPPFHGGRLQLYGELIDGLTEDALDRWPMGQPFELLPELQELTLEIILRVVFGVGEAQRHAALRDRIRVLVRFGASDVTGVRYALRRMGTLRFWRAFHRAHANADALIYEEIARRREQSTAGEDVLSLLLQARDEEGRPLTDAELRDELVTLLVAGHETTATGLAWAFELLARHPEAMARLTEEVRAGQEDRYTNAVVQETLRLRPPVGVMARRVRQPFVVGGYELPPGVRLVPGIPNVNRHPDVYPDPDSFRPERFLERPPDTYAWIPFGGGVRRCIGASLAQFEMRRVLAVVLRRASLRAAGSRPDSPVRRAIVYPPRRGARVVLERREPRPSPRPQPFTSAAA